jgi:transcriptional regulator with XRE-family HTH domain
MPISSKQIRAARGLLNLSQKVLAHKAGLSVNSLNNIEREVGSPRVDSMHAIRDALTREGIEFLERDGVRLAGEQLEIEKIEGANILMALYEEWLRAFPSGNGEVLIMGKDNSRLKHDEPALLHAYKRFETFALKNNIKERALFLQDDTNFLSLRNIYRWVPPQFFGEVPMAIYGSSIAILLWGPPSRLVIIRNPGIAETFRQHFEAIWSMATPVPDAVHKFHYQLKTQKILDAAKHHAKTAEAAPVKSTAKKRR